MVTNLTRIDAHAVVPDQLLSYVSAVSGLESRMVGECILHLGSDHAVLIAYPAQDSLNTAKMEESLELALKLPGLKHITVLSPHKLASAPDSAITHEDSYWMLPLPFEKTGGKLKNMLKRARRDLHIEQAMGPDAWKTAHSEMAQDFCARKSLDDGTKYLFARLGDYLAASPEAVLFSAFNKADSLNALAIADFGSLDTCFYMFACRKRDAIPGAADLLLSAIIAEAEKRGHARVNLGLGIEKGVEFFKRKWGAQKWLPLVESSWDIPKKGWLARLLGR